MKQIVVMPGGFHPFHAGHMSLYNAAKKAFPGADVYVAATDSREERPFPFAVKEKLAKVAGVDPGHFIQVKSPFQAKEITQRYNPDQDVLIFVRSEKDRNESPKPGGTKKDGSPAYFQPFTGKNMQPFSKHAYMAYLPTVTFGPGIKSATEIRNSWPNLSSRQKTAMVLSLYPATQKNTKLAANVVAMLDQVMGGAQNIAEAQLGQTMSWPEFTNDLTKAMRATGWGAVRKNEDAFIFSIKGQEEDEFYVIIVQNIGNGFFRYGLGTVEQGDPHMDDAFRGELPLTRASLSQLMEMIREGYGLIDEAANAAQQAAIAINMKKHHKKPKVQEFAPGPGGDGGEEPDEEEILRRLASQWWNGTEQQMFKAEKTLAAMGWEIGQDDGYDQGGVFVVRAGDEQGKSYISWPHESLDEIQEAQNISEVGDQPYQATPRWRGNGMGTYTKSIVLPDNRHLEIVVEYEKPYALVNFYIDSAQQKTGKGDAYKIFATVGKEVNDFVGKYKPDILAFTASMAEESRIKLYDRFADRMVKSLPNFTNYTNISDDEELYGDLLSFADDRHDIQDQILYVFASPKYMKEIETMAETKSPVIAKTVKDVLNPPKVMQQRAIRDKQKIDQYMQSQKNPKNSPSEFPDKLHESTDYLEEK